MTRFTSIALFIFLSGGTGSPAAVAGQTAGHGLSAGVATDFRVDTYAVTGSTVEALHSAMLSAGPTVQGRTWFGYTEWHVAWRFGYAPDGRGCHLSDVTVEFTGRTTVPRWEGRAGADPGLVDAWLDFSRGLETHERGHRDIGLEAARHVLRTLRSFRAPRCTGMVEAANAAGHEVLDRFRERERRYDRSTDHGRTQGAVWGAGRGPATVTVMVGPRVPASGQK